jgi:peroxiredoxin Q/BCP
MTMHKFAERILVTASVVFLCSPALYAGNVAAPPVEQDPLRAGIKAPNFTRVTTSGKKISLKEFRGKPVILYFYPKDETPNCIKEACGFRDFFNGLRGSEAEIIGVSGDSDDSHKAFASHYSLPYDLISDTDDSLLRMYHVPNYKSSLHKRVTFVIDKHGYIANVIHYTNDGETHVKEATAALEMMKSNLSQSAP